MKSGMFLGTWLAPFLNAGVYALVSFTLTMLIIAMKRAAASQ